MKKAQKATLRAQLIVGYTNTLKTVRRSVKGLRAGNLWGIMLAGDSPNGIRLIEMHNITGVKYGDCFQRVNRGIRDGWMYKADKRYYLTERGQQVYTLVCNAFDKEYKAIVAAIVADVQKRIK